MQTSSLRLYITLFLMWISHFLVDFMIGIWSIFKTIEHLDLAIAGLIAGVSALAGEGMQIFFGSLSDRGWRKFLIMSGILLTCCSAFIPYFESYYAFFFLYMLTCMGSGAFHPSASGLIGRLPSQRRGFFMTIFASGGFLGLACSQITFVEAYAYFNGNIGWLAMPLFLLAGALMFYPLPEHNVKKSASIHQVSHLLKIFHFFKRRDLTLLYIIQVCNQTILWATMFLLPDVLHSRGYEPWIAFGCGHLCFVLGAGILLAPAGYLADKYSTKSVLIGGFLIGMVTYYTFLGFQDMPPMVLLPLLFMMGASIGILNPVCVALGTRLVPDHPGMISAFLMGLVWCVSEVLGPSGGGYLSTFFTEDAPAYALAIIGSFFIVGIIATTKLVQEIKEEEQVAIATG